VLLACFPHEPDRSIDFRRRERQISVTPPLSIKREHSAFYDHRNNVLVGLPESWGTWRRPIVITESLEGVSLEPVSAITEDVSIGTMSLYSLYHDESSPTETSPLLSAVIQVPYLLGPTSSERTQEQASPPLNEMTEHLSKVSVLAHPGTTNSHVESEEAAKSDWANSNEPNDSQLLIVPPRWGSNMTNSFQLTPRHLLPRRSARPLPPTPEVPKYA
jgi:hypothetical protein